MVVVVRMMDLFVGLDDRFVCSDWFGPSIFVLTINQLLLVFASHYGDPSLLLLLFRTTSTVNVSSGSCFVSLTMVVVVWTIDLFVPTGYSLAVDRFLIGRSIDFFLFSLLTMVALLFFFFFSELQQLSL